MKSDIDTITVATSYYKELMLELANLRHQKELTTRLLAKLEPLLEQITPKPNVALLDWVQWIQAAQDELHRQITPKIDVNLSNNICPDCGDVYFSIPRMGILHECRNLSGKRS